MAGHLERLCHKQGLDDLAERDIMLELLRRQLECQCQVLFDVGELLKDALRG
jgi:hypothetical protein